MRDKRHTGIEAHRNWGTQESGHTGIGAQRSSQTDDLAGSRREGLKVRRRQPVGHLLGSWPLFVVCSSSCQAW